MGVRVGNALALSLPEAVARNEADATAERVTEFEDATDALSATLPLLLLVAQLDA